MVLFYRSAFGIDVFGVGFLAINLIGLFGTTWSGAKFHLGCQPPCKYISFHGLDPIPVAECAGCDEAHPILLLPQGFSICACLRPRFEWLTYYPFDPLARAFMVGLDMSSVVYC
ncbi:hypothetical protein BDZ45DRAFT_98306 [Acephala macrosclerotiorum]|nr:hypothetical protein BDZ45DRAFT_98306 [Acephala macrosclerotiorum]